MLDYHKRAGERLNELMDREVIAPDGKRIIRAEERHAIHHLTSKPPQGSRIGCWRNEMTDIDRESFEKVAGKMLRDLGYDADLLGDTGESFQPQWIERLDTAIQEIMMLIPPGDNLDQWGTSVAISGRWRIPFPERDGQYWGLLPDDDTAIREFERLRQLGTSFMVFGWPAFWWLDYYSGLHQHLRSNFRCVLENDRLLVFDLRS